MAREIKIKGNTKIHESTGDVILNVITAIIMVAVILVVGYPLIYVVSCSVSSTAALNAGKVILWPVDFSLEGYQFVLQYQQVWIGFRNSIFYTFVKTVLTMTLTVLVAYPLSRRDFQGKGLYTMIFFMSTKIYSGMIPTFILKTNLGLFNNIWAVILSGLVAVSHILILRTAIKSSIPSELFDSAMLDGANHFQCITKLVLPLAKATLSVLILYCIVAEWNEYFTAMLYLRDINLYPLQLVLRPIMQAASTSQSIAQSGVSISTEMANEGLENVRYALILISSVPVMIAYAFVQKYFKGGVMMGSVKG